jgi:N-acyl-D-aspartate/D-glutamate deacylase
MIVQLIRKFSTILTVVVALIGVGAGSGLMSAWAAQYDVVIENGRVIDPETNFDGVANVGIRDGVIKRISKKRLKGERVIDAEGLVVAPGFIDLHAHGQNLIASGLQARDGVTTALEQEQGAYPIAPFYEAREGKARINFGASVSQAGLRIKVTTGIEAGHQPTSRDDTGGLFHQKHVWAESAISEEKIDQVLELFREEIEAGGLGLGLAHEYLPGTDRREVYLLMKEAGKLNAPVFTHVRMANHPDVGGQLEMMQEVIANATVLGTPLHICHVTSKGLNDTALILDAITHAQENGLDITTEAYPYTAGSTALGSALFNEGWQERWASTYSDIEWTPTGERLTEETFYKYRKEHPGAAVVFHMIPEEAMNLAIAHPLVMIASDGMTFAGGSGHPRGAGSYSRVLGHFVREKQALSLMDALRKMTIMPAQRMEGIAPVMKRKGRLQEGMDADITVFDPDTVIDRATYKDGMQPSKGIMHVLVGGVAVVSDAELQADVFPGKAIRGGAYQN